MRCPDGGRVAWQRPNAVPVDTCRSTRAARDPATGRPHATSLEANPRCRSVQPRIVHRLLHSAAEIASRRKPLFTIGDAMIT